MKFKRSVKLEETVVLAIDVLEILINNKRKKHRQALEILKTLKGKRVRVVVPTAVALIFIERMEKESKSLGWLAIKWLCLSDVDMIENSAEDLRLAGVFLSQVDRRELSYVDCVSLVIAKRQGARAMLSFNDSFVKNGLVLAVTLYGV